MKKYISLFATLLVLGVGLVSCDNNEPSSPDAPVNPSGAQAITLNQTSLKLQEGDFFDLQATTEPAGVVVTWTSSNNGVATVSKTGKVAAMSIGEATISAKAGDKVATCVVTVEEKVIPTDPSLLGSNYYLFALDEESFAKIPAEKIVKDYRVNDQDIQLYIWPSGDSYSEGSAVGKNSYGLAQPWICLRSNQEPWGGTGAGASNSANGHDFTATDDTYVFHCAYKSTDGGKNEVGFFMGNKKELWVELPAQTDGEWHVFEKTLGEIGLSYPNAISTAENILAFRSQPAGTTINLDACFIYKK